MKFMDKASVAQELIENLAIAETISTEMLQLLLRDCT
jgi:hypothetical protein